MPRGAKQPSAVFKSVLEEAEEKLALSSKGSGSTAFQHRGVKGDERASALGNFLRERLPGQFNIAKGEAIDFGDRRTGQLDLVIYDSGNSSPILTGSENVLLPAESLYVVIEVKTILTQDELDKAFKSAASVRSLRPFKNEFVPSRNTGAPNNGSCRCMYLVFAYDTNLSEENWLAKEFQRLQSAAKKSGKEMDLIDRIVVLNRGMINPSDSAGRQVTTDNKSIFLEFFLHLVNFINRERTRRLPVDWQMYAPRTVPGWQKLS